MSELLLSACLRASQKRRESTFFSSSKRALMPLKNIIAALPIVLSGFGPMAHAQQSRSLPESMEKSVMSHPEVQARYHDFLSTLEGKNIERGGLRPQVSVEAWTGREWRTGGSTEPSTNWSRNGYSLQLRQLLFDGFSTINTVRQHGFEKLSAYFTLLHTVDSLALEAALAHLDVLRYRELERLAHENYQAHLDTHAQITERQESGVGRGVDLSQSAGRLALAQANLMTESGNLNDVSQRYQRLVGDLPPPVLLDAPAVDDWLPKKPDRFIDELRSNPELLAKQALVQAGSATVDAAKGNHSPTLELRASSGKDHSQPGLPYRDAHSSNVQLVLSSTFTVAVPTKPACARPWLSSMLPVTSVITPVATYSRNCPLRGTTSSSCASSFLILNSTSRPPPGCAQPISNSSRSANARCSTCLTPSTSCSMQDGRWPTLRSSCAGKNCAG